MKRFVRAIRDIEVALGSARRPMGTEEQQRRRGARRSAYLAGPVNRGQKLRVARIEFRRPGDGIAGDVYESLLDLEFRADLPAGHMLRLSDLA